MTRFFVATALGVMLASGPVFAESQPAGKQHRQQAGAGSLEFVTAQQESEWLASTLIGRSVTNPAGETLGGINDVVVDEQGQVAAVVIGVGGVLGIGEKHVGVRYPALQFEAEPEPPQAQPTGTPTAQTPEQDPDHGDKRIVLDVTKDQLESAPPYRKLGEETTAEKTEQ